MQSLPSEYEGIVAQLDGFLDSIDLGSAVSRITRKGIFHGQALCLRDLLTQLSLEANLQHSITTHSSPAFDHAELW